VPHCPPRAIRSRCFRVPGPLRVRRSANHPDSGAVSLGTVWHTKEPTAPDCGATGRLGLSFDREGARAGDDGRGHPFTRSDSTRGGSALPPLASIIRTISV
jgi:hypothetical protein